MFNKFFSLTACAFAILLFGCSDKELENVKTSENNAIGFHLVSNASEAVSRAVPTTPSNLTSTSFDVFAFTEDGSLFMGNHDTDFAHYGVKIVYDGSNWVYSNPDETHYWPTTALNFYAVNPVIDTSNEMYGNYLWTITNTKQQIKYSCIDEYHSTSNPKNLDVMYAIAKNQKKTTNSGKVKFKFQHILSQIVFNAKTEYANMEVDIKDIKIHNIKFSGTFTFPEPDGSAQDTPTPTNSNWALENAIMPSSCIVNNKNITVTGNASTTNISSDSPFLIVPQQLTAWVVKDAEGNVKTKADADNAKQCYLEICCKIKQEGAYLFASEGDYGTIYVPFGATWEPGKRYVYTLIFGGGYDEHGNPILTPIQYDNPTVEGWIDTPLTSSIGD